MHEQAQSASVPAPDYRTEHVVFPGSSVGSAHAPNLEGVLTIPSGEEAHPAAVLCHANPKGGGHMEMKVMQAIASALAEKGIASLRYNSRGIGESEGEISGYSNRKLVTPEGEPEVADVGRALDFVAGQRGIDQRRLALVGHSFGARITLAYLAQRPADSRIKAVVCIGLGVAWGDLSHLGQWPKPKLFITGEHDDFCPPELLEEFVAKLPAPANQVVLKNTGHFFEGRESDMASVVAEYLEDFGF